MEDGGHTEHQVHKEPKSNNKCYVTGVDITGVDITTISDGVDEGMMNPT